MATTAGEGGGSSPKPKPKPRPKKRPKPVRPNNRAAAAAAKARAEAIARAQARSAEARSRAAAAAAIAKAKQAAMVRARAVAYEALRKKQIEAAQRYFQGNLVKPRPMVKAPAGPASDALTLQQEKAAMRAAAAKQAAAAAAAKAKRDLIVAQGAYQYQLPNGTYVTRYTTKPGDSKTGKDIENQIRAEAARAAADGTVDTDYLDKLQKKYEAHSDATYKLYERLVAKINAALASGNTKLAKKLYRSEEFNAAKGEFARLFGTGKNPLKDGEYGKFYKEYQNISLSQNKWWKSQLKASLQTELQQLNSMTGPLTDAQLQQKRMLQAQVDAFNGKTGWVDDGFDKKTGNRKMRRRTVEEELAHQQALIEMQRQQMVANRLEAERRLRKDMIFNNQVFYDGAVVRKEDVPLYNDAKRLKELQPDLFPEGGAERPEDVQALAGGLISQWEQTHPKPKTSGARQGGPAFARAMKVWSDKRDQYERQVYALLGQSVPQVWDRIAGLPVVSHGLALLQGGNSAIGALGRVGTAALTGDSSKVGIDSLNWNDAPASAPKAPSPTGMNRSSYQKALDLYYRRREEWLKTPEGQKWAQEQGVLNRQRSAEEDIAFQQGFYGGNTNALPQIAKDPGEALRALNAYGQSPFQNDAANLLFQLLADPTNAIPLKATTYLARGKYAFEAAQQAKGLTAPTAKAAAAMKGFLTIDEGSLKLIMEGEKAMKDFEKLGSLEKFTDEYRAITANLDKLSEKRSVFNTMLRKAGFLPREAPESHLFNIVEQLAESRAVAKGLHLLTEVEKQSEIVEAALKKADDAEAAAAEKLRVDRLLSQEGQRIKDTRQSSAREVLIAERKQAEAIKHGEIVPEVPKGTVGSRLRAAFPDRKQNYFEKDVQKASTANKFIGVGGPGSSTEAYNKALGGADTTFKSTDRVFVSANGNRKGRIPVTKPDGTLTPGYKNLDAAIDAKATIITDTPVDRIRPYNSGEREVANYLKSRDYDEIAPGVWTANTPVSKAMKAAPPDSTVITPKARIEAEAAGRPPFRDPFTGEPRPFASGTRQKYVDAIADVQAGRPAIDPDTGQPIVALSKEHALRSLRQRMNALPPEDGPKPNFDPPPEKVAAAEEKLEKQAAAEAWLDVDAPSPWTYTDPYEVMPLPTISEASYLRREKFKAYTVLSDRKASPKARNAARARIRLIEDAEGAVKKERKSGQYVRRVVKLHGKGIEDVVPPNMISPLGLSAYDASVEMARTIWRRLKTTPQGPVESKVNGILMNGKRVEYIPKNVFDDVHNRVSAAIRNDRGFKNDLLTRKKTKGASESDTPIDEEPPIPKAGSMSDKDPLVINAKKRALDKYFKETGTRITMEAYDEARNVLWRAVTQDMMAKSLLRKARRRRLLTGETLEDAFLHLRKEAAKKESVRQLGAVAHEMVGMDPESVLAEFMHRYSDDGILYHPATPLSPFQQATMENYIRDITGFNDLEGDQMRKFLASANRPPLHNRELTKSFLTRIGAWSPRRSELFLKDATSWSVTEEANYWMVNYGEIPEWADELALSRADKEFFRNDVLHYAQLKSWGFFNRSADLELRASGKTAADIEKANIEGGRRSLAQQRKYAFERYGRLVSKDGETLDEMPWLMTDDEYRVYMSRITAENALPPHFIQNAEEMDEVIELIGKAMDSIFDKYITAKAVDGVVDYVDLLRLASEVQATLLANPKWLKRHRDVFGNSLNAWAAFNRWLVFNNPSFLVTNTIDAPIKTGYYRFTRRGLFNPGLRGASEDALRNAAEMTPSSLGYDATSAMYRIKQASPLSRIRDPRGYTNMEKAVDRALGLFEASPLGAQLYPEIAGRVELAHQMALARGMYPQWYDHGIKLFGNSDAGKQAADAFAKRNVAKEARHMWPTAGDGPIERLWNRLVPFATYSIRNKVLFVSEAVGHPALLNYVDALGRYIEKQNLEDWESDPETAGKEMPTFLRRRLELPWANGYYLDLSTFSDASRGLAPIFGDTSGKSYLDLAATWIRLVNPGPQAGIYALFNAFNLFPKYGWVADENGVYQKVVVGWSEPWSQDAPDMASVFWMVSAMESAEKYGFPNLSPGEASLLLGQVLFFNGISTYDRSSVLNSYYFALKATDPAAAKAWLLTPDGLLLREKWEDMANRPQDAVDMFHQLEKGLADPSRWFHSQSKEFQNKVNAARDEIRSIRSAFSAELALLTPGTAAYREMKARMYVAINNVYLNSPELNQADIYAKSPADWSTQLEEWATDKLMDDFMALNKFRPSRGDYKDTKTYNAAVQAWELQKQTFLHQYPQVAQRLNSGRTQLDLVRDQMNREWDRILDRVAARNEAIDDAKKVIAEAGRDSKAGAKAQDFLDRAYLMNELDYSLLERDYAVVDFAPDDFERLPGGVMGPLKQNGSLLKRASVLIDFDRTRYEKALREGNLDEFLAAEAYGEKMRAAIYYAKGNDPFGEFDGKRWADYMDAHPDLQKQYFQNNGSQKKFKDTARYIEGIRALWAKAGDDPAAWVRLIKQDPWLMREYFKRNPGKEAKWARTEAYIKNISVWGRLIGAQRYDEANAAWDRLPQWVKDEYYRKHPERRQRAQQTSQYLGYMQKWVKLFDNPDKTLAMKYFQSLPEWAKERYFKKHPGNRIKFGLDAEMGVKLAYYFAGDKTTRAQYLKENPDLAKWLAKNSPSKATERMSILAAYQSIPSSEAWLRRVFREKYPEIFSQEAAGERRLRSVYDTLAAHPEMTQSFEEWVKVIWETYAENLKHAPRPANSYFEFERDVPARYFVESLSAEEADKLSKRRARSQRNPQ